MLLNLMRLNERSGGVRPKMRTQVRKPRRTNLEGTSFFLRGWRSLARRQEKETESTRRKLGGEILGSNLPSREAFH